MKLSANQARAVHILRAAAILIGIACLILGANRGEAAVVLRKAVRICLECIGVAG